MKLKEKTKQSLRITIRLLLAVIALGIALLAGSLILK